jgi:hypothetical protein
VQKPEADEARAFALKPCTGPALALWATSGGAPGPPLVASGSPLQKLYDVWVPRWRKYARLRTGISAHATEGCTAWTLHLLVEALTASQSCTEPAKAFEYTVYGKTHDWGTWCSAQCDTCCT